jgi:Mrp family chromosome partitioning ATPase
MVYGTEADQIEDTMSRTDEILNALRSVTDPDLNRSIVELGFVRQIEGTESGDVVLGLALTTPACPLREWFREQCHQALNALPWVKSVQIRWLSTPPATSRDSDHGLAQVSRILAVGSCKGGVGKSTVAVNLAFSFARLGARVGIFDADIFGPSLPTMVHPRERLIRVVNGRLLPLVYENVRLQSFGFVAQEEGPAIMRGPMVSQVLLQLLTQTDWGELDYLVVDLPPGTGDIQLTLLQAVELVAAVMVTTPQELSFVDVVKGIQMFDRLQVPVAGVVENMSWFQCPACGSTHHLFGPGVRERVREQFGIPLACELPLLPEVSTWGDSGRPAVCAAPESEFARRLNEFAAGLVREISRLEQQAEPRPEILWQPGTGILVRTPGQPDRVIAPALLRSACACALCVDERTGQRRVESKSVPANVHPVRIQPMGRYAVAVEWSDGHSSSIYPYDRLLALAQPVP